MQIDFSRDDGVQGDDLRRRPIKAEGTAGQVLRPARGRRGRRRGARPSRSKKVHGALMANKNLLRDRTVLAGQADAAWTPSTSTPTARSSNCVASGSAGRCTTPKARPGRSSAAVIELLTALDGPATRDQLPAAGRAGQTRWASPSRRPRSSSGKAGIVKRRKGGPEGSGRSRKWRPRRPPASCSGTRTWATWCTPARTVDGEAKADFFVPLDAFKLAIARPARLHGRLDEAVRGGLGAQADVHRTARTVRAGAAGRRQAGGPGGLEDQRPRAAQGPGGRPVQGASTWSTQLSFMRPTKVASDKVTAGRAQPAGGEPGRAAAEGDGDDQGAGRTRRSSSAATSGTEEGDGLPEAGRPGAGVRGRSAACSTSSRRRTCRTRSSTGSTRRR